MQELPEQKKMELKVVQQECSVVEEKRDSTPVPTTLAAEGEREREKEGQR